MRKVYMESMGGEYRGLTLTPVVENDVVLLPTTFRVNMLDPSYSIHETQGGLEVSSSLDELPTYYLKELTLDDVDKIFPNTIRTFESVESLEDFVVELLHREMSYIVPEVNDTTYSFTVDDNDTVLELIYTNPDGDMFYRSDGDWVIIGVDDEMPTVFDQVLIDILPEDSEKAIEFWDSAAEQEDTVSKEEVLKFAALVQ